MVTVFIDKGSFVIPGKKAFGFLLKDAIQCSLDILIAKQMMHRQTEDAVGHTVSIREIGRIGRFEATVGGELGDQRVEVAAAEDVTFFHLGVERVAGHSVGFLVDEDREVGVVVLYSRHILEEGDAFDIAERFAVFDGYLLAGCDG